MSEETQKILSDTEHSMNKALDHLEPLDALFLGTSFHLVEGLDLIVVWLIVLVVDLFHS